MKALIKKNASNAKNLYSEKETVSRYSIVGTMGGELREMAIVRCYMARSRSASVVYASIWVFGEHSTSGYGTAGGGGYHKESAAIQAALDSAGIELWGDANSEGGKVFDYSKKEYVNENLENRCYIDGRGDRAITEALKAIGKAAGLGDDVGVFKG